MRELQRKVARATMEKTGLKNLNRRRRKDGSIGASLFSRKWRDYLKG